MSHSRLIAVLGPGRPKCPHCQATLDAIRKVRLRAWNYWWRDTLAVCPHCDSVLGFGRS